MTTALDIATRALRRINVIDALETPSAEDGQDAIQHLNDMMFEWLGYGVDIKHVKLASSDTLLFMVPPGTVTHDVIEAATSKGSWDASANSPALATNTGTKGYFYKVTVAGSTTLNDVTSWSVNDYALFNGSAWVKAGNSRRFDGGIAAMLALRMAPEYGAEPSAVLVSQADAAWRSILAAFLRAPEDSYDSGIVDTPGRRSYVADLEADA